MKKRTVIYCNLKELLLNKDISIRQLSQEINEPFESIRRLHNNDTTRYSKQILEKICDYLDVQIEDILKIEKINRD
ncbi:helix-turn-helix transcriptional regulator [Heyndrickxia oleronia]|uniref:Helix-turn-helix transcriptional regulator n=1 Tax=Heyndrickxia oleronia TaxID=38875 RepID=A0AAW6T1H4_9BACI|nr:helix-turn-helix transcriptional regulator [Heyndrickxia oleronia]MCM3240769.1 helix-turn-helix transcriptional regulator [Heyndrickxia oleronia]MDH5163427.1 helix-turn-helix transcriptional regulator [Heyndrickxia oleronia]